MLEAERLGFDSVWTAEAYGSDATSPLAYLAAMTDRIRLGTSVLANGWRHPALLAKEAAAQGALTFVCHAETWNAPWHIAELTGAEIVIDHGTLW